MLAQRDARIIADAKAGIPVGELATRYGVSNARIYQVTAGLVERAQPQARKPPRSKRGSTTQAPRRRAPLASSTAPKLTAVPRLEAGDTMSNSIRLVLASAPPEGFGYDEICAGVAGSMTRDQVSKVLSRLTVAGECTRVSPGRYRLEQSASASSSA